MNVQSFQEWISGRFRRGVFAAFLMSFGILFLAATYFGLLDRIQAILNESQGFASSQVLNLQVYDYTRLNFDLQTFSKEKPFEFIRVYDVNGMTIGKWSKSGKDLEGTGTTLSFSKCFWSSNRVQMDVSRDLNHVIVKTNIVDSKGNLIGTLEVFLTMLMFLRNFLLVGSVFLALVVIIYFVLKISLLQIARITSAPVAEIAQALRLTGTTRELEKINVKSNILEIKLLIERFHELSRRLADREAEHLKTERLTAIGNLSAQVAHDIRSPLAALEMMIADSPQFNENYRLMIRSAVGRIRDISNQLSENKSGTYEAFKNVSEKEDERFPQLLASLIEPLITEKRMQFRSKLGVKIEAELGVSSYGLFANLSPSEFKRILSNLIDNAVEALPEAGSVNLTLHEKDDQIELRIQDDGKGIAPDVLPTLMQRGVSYEKETGSGLGLYHARTSLEALGGSLSLQSQVGVGTTVIVTLPSAEPPVWFLKELVLAKDSSVIILDDDESIHQIWKGRFECLKLHEKGVQLQHFSTPEAILKWYKNRPLPDTQNVFLIDYELLGQKQTGLEIIEDLQLQENSILVTSHYEETKVRARCMRLDVKLLPKGMAGFVPIVSGEETDRFVQL